MTDEEKTQRRRHMNECSKCFCTRIAGQAFWAFTCSLCGQEKMHPNTAVPKVCAECSKEKNVCRRCGGPMD